MMFSLDCPLWLQKHSIFKEKTPHKLLLLVYMTCFIKYMNVNKSNIKHDRSHIKMGNCYKWNSFSTPSHLMWWGAFSLSNTDRFTQKGVKIYTSRPGSIGYAYCITNLHLTQHLFNLYAVFIKTLRNEITVWHLIKT